MRLITKCILVAVLAPPLQFLGVPFMQGETFEFDQTAPQPVVKELPPNVLSKNEKAKYASLTCHEGDWWAKHEKMPMTVLIRPVDGGDVQRWHFDSAWEAASDGLVWIITSCAEPIWKGPR